MEAESARARLLQLLRSHAVLHGDFVLSSGQRSDYYIDARVVTLSSDGGALVGSVFLETIGDADVDAVAGLAVGADPIVTSIAVMAGLAGKAIDGLIVRKEAKSHGVGGRIVGPWHAGRRVAVVDDALTTGGSLLEAARAIESNGGQVQGLYALIDRRSGGREAVERAGYACRTIFDVSELLYTS